MCVVGHVLRAFNGVLFLLLLSVLLGMLPRMWLVVVSASLHALLCVVVCHHGVVVVIVSKMDTLRIFLFFNDDFKA